MIMFIWGILSKYQIDEFCLGSSENNGNVNWLWCFVMPWVQGSRSNVSFVAIFDGHLSPKDHSEFKTKK